MILLLSFIIVLFISYLVYKYTSIVQRSISYSYYESRETAVIWGSFAALVGMIVAFSFLSPLTLIAGICLTLVPIFGDFENKTIGKKYIKYVHYSLAVTFYALMLIYTQSYTMALPYITIMLILLYNRNKKLSVFWLEVIGIVVIIISLLIKSGYLSIV